MMLAKYFLPPVSRQSRVEKVFIVIEAIENATTKLIIQLHARTYRKNFLKHSQYGFLSLTLRLLRIKIPK